MSRESTIDKILTKDVLAKEYEDLKSFRLIGEKYKISRETVRYYIKKYGLDYNKPVRYSCNENFFTENNEATFYVAGFSLADACIKARKEKDPNIFSIELARKDESLLNIIKKLLQAENPINYWIGKNSKRNPKWNDTEKCALRITSRKMCIDIERFGVIQRKTHIVRFPEWLIIHPLVHHFMRGYIDGDGSFYRNDGNSVSQIYFNVRGTIEFLSVFRSILERENLVDIRDTEIRVNSGIGTLDYGGNGVVSKLASFLYKDATIYLQRKYDLTQQAIETTKSTEIKKIEVEIKKEEKAQIAFRKAAHKWLSHKHPTSSKDLKDIYKGTGTLRKTAKELGVRVSAARNLLAKNGIEINSSNLNFTKEQLESLYKKHGQLNLVAKELGCNPSTITKYMKDYGLEFSSSRAYDHNHAFFSKENESKEQLYWAGYLLGNSSIDMKTNMITVTCKDKNEIERFSKSGITTAPIHEVKVGSYIDFVSIQMITDLKERFGITSEKVVSFKFSEWLKTHPNLKDFLQGRLNRNGKLTAEKTYVEFLGSLEYLQDLQSMFTNWFGFKTKNEIRLRLGSSSFRLVYTGKPASEIGRYFQYDKKEQS